MRQTRRRLSLSDRFLQSRDHQPYRQRSIQFPANHFARIGIENHGLADKLTMLPEISDVGNQS
jgi:hypothetical protein